MKISYCLSMLTVGWTYAVSNPLTASTIVWDSGVVVDQGDVVGTGSLLGAYNFGLSTAPDVMVNEVLFKALQPSGTSGNSGAEGYMSWRRTGGSSNFVRSGSVYAGAGDNLGQSYFDLLSTGACTSGSGAQNSNTYSFTFSNLIEGNTYMVQFWTYNSTYVLSSQTVRFSDDGTPANSISVLRNQTNEAGSPGAWVTAAFVADETGQASISVAGSQYLNLNAVQIRNVSIPEPGIAVLSLAGLSLCLVRHRR